MRSPGQIELVRFPHVDLSPGKPRPVLLLASVPGPYDDWLVCMISSKLHQEVQGFDDVIAADDADFAPSGLKGASVFRIARLAVVTDELMLGGIGEISEARLARIRTSVANWIQGAPN
jgi:mRNA interferase MazF